MPVLSNKFYPVRNTTSDISLEKILVLLYNPIPRERSKRINQVPSIVKQSIITTIKKDYDLLVSSDPISSSFSNQTNQSPKSIHHNPGSINSSPKSIHHNPTQINSPSRSILDEIIKDYERLQK